MNFLKISKFFLYLVPFSVLIVSLSTLFPFIVGKYVFFRVVVELALISYLLHWAFQFKEVRPRKVKIPQILKSPLVIAVSIFVLIFLLAGFFGINPKYSFWSNFERGEGGLQMLHLFIFFLLLVLLFRDEKSWRKMFVVSLWAAGLMVVYGLAAALKIKGFVGGNLCERLQGSLGNPAYVGTYLIFTLFYTGYLLFSEQRKFKKWLWLVLLIFFSFFLLLTQTRGAFMGLGTGLIAFSFYLVKVLPSGWLRKFSLISGIFLVILGSLIIIFRPSRLNPIPFCPPAVGTRLLGGISIYNPSSQPRLWTWVSAIKGFKERPIFGWGPENFPAVFDKYFDTRHYLPATPQGSQTWFDRAHSIFLDYLVATGILGLLSYLSIFIVFYWQFLRKTRINQFQEVRPPKINRQYLGGRTSQILESALIFALPIAYLVQGIVLFEVLPIYINLFLFLAFAVYKFGSTVTVTKPVSSSVKCQT